MATITTLSAAKAQEILGQSVVSGQVNNVGHLILTRNNGTTIDAGDFSSILIGLLSVAVDQEIDAQLPAAVATAVVGTRVSAGNVSGTLNIASLFSADTLINGLLTATLTGAVTIDTANMPANCRPGTQFAARFTQDATGGRTLSLPGFKKSQGVLTLSTSPNAVDIVVFLYDGTNWYAGLMGVDFK